MPNANSPATVVSLHRFPVKSMMGEELNSVDVTDRGLLGDRAWALLDAEDGKVASAKNPRKWPRLFDCRAAFVAPPQAGAPLPAVRITLPDGTLLESDQPDVAERLSAAVARKVTLASAPPDNPSLEEYWPDMEGLSHQNETTDEAMPAGTFFDLAAVHLLTTATLDRLRELYPEGRFEVRRFRPNVVVHVPGGGFVENEWIGRTVAIGDAVRLEVTGPCPRCVMTTLPQADLPQDPGILRAAARHNGANVGVYASVVQGGRVRRGDAVTVE